MTNKPKTKNSGSRVAERPKLTDARVKTRGAKGGGKTESAGEPQSAAGVRCSALLGDVQDAKFYASYQKKLQKARKALSTELLKMGKKLEKTIKNSPTVEEIVARIDRIYPRQGPPKGGTKVQRTRAES